MKGKLYYNSSVYSWEDVVCSIFPKIFGYDILKEFKDHPLVKKLGNKQGIVIKTSGTAGKQKLALYDYELFMQRFFEKKTAYTTVVAMTIDSLGGIDAMLKTILSGGDVIFPNRLVSADVVKCIKEYSAELLVASPSMLRLLALSDVAPEDLSTIKIVAYGSERMLESNLAILSKLFKNAKFKQTYGTTETGTLRTHSESSNSIWLQILDPSKYKIVDNVLWIKSDGAFLGYLNSEGPLTDDGWFVTGDVVKVSGNYIKILGRRGDVINVGGRKVFPHEIEDVIISTGLVKDVVVFGEPNDFLGEIVVANIVPISEKYDTIIRDIKDFCTINLSKYEVPMKICIVSDVEYSNRMKKVRRG